jgi:hypothetical protein
MVWVPLWRRQMKSPQRLPSRLLLLLRLLQPLHSSQTCKRIRWPPYGCPLDLKEPSDEMEWIGMNNTAMSHVQSFNINVSPRNDRIKNRLYILHDTVSLSRIRLESRMTRKEKTGCEGEVSQFFWNRGRFCIDESV